MRERKEREREVASLGQAVPSLRQTGTFLLGLAAMEPEETCAHKEFTSSIYAAVTIIL